MTRTLLVRNRQRTCAVDTRFLRRLAHWALVELGEAEFELGIHLVEAAEMASLNETFLQHEGSTDVITFDHRNSPGPSEGQRGGSSSGSGPEVPGSDPILHGEIFISLDDAVRQARQFRTTWQKEVVRYFLHGVLHLLGMDDRSPAARRMMKFAEDRVLHHVARQFPIERLCRSKARRGEKTGNPNP